MNKMEGNSARDDSTRERRLAQRRELYRLHTAAKTPEQERNDYTSQFKHLILS